jgi:hypothetical protein
MHRWMNGSDYAWMPLTMVFGLLVLGAVVYIAVKIGNRPSA